MSSLLLQSSVNKEATRVIINQTWNTMTIIPSSSKYEVAQTGQERLLSPTPTSPTSPTAHQKKPIKEQEIVFVDDSATFTQEADKPVLQERRVPFKKKDNEYDKMTKYFKFR